MNVDKFGQQIEALHSRVAVLQQRNNELPFSQQEIVTAAFKELYTALEELKLAEEELLQQNEELCQQNQELEITRRALEVERQRYQELFEEAPDGYLVTDPQGTIQAANCAAATLLNVSQKFLVGQPLITFVPESERLDVQSHLTQPRRVGNWVREWELRLQPIGRSNLIDVAVVVAAVCNRQGQLIALRWLLRDITYSKWAEKEREQLLAREQEARAEAEAANRLKDEFLSVLSHEIRTPLNAILGWASLLRTRKFDEATTARALETIERNAKTQAQLIEDLLDVSRIIQGKLRLDVRPIELYSVLEAAIETVRPAADAKAIQLHTVLDPRASSVSGDYNRLQQVVWNLLSNAVKFTPKGGCVEVYLERVDEYAQIRVCDTGQGITAEFLPYVFERFCQADSNTTRLHGGLGLGLAIVRHLMELHGGTVHADSPGEGQGAMFTVKLPLLVIRREMSDSESQRRQVTADNNLVSDRGPKLNGLRVLVVDDEADTRELLITALEQYGAKVTAAASVGEALAALEQFRPDVLVSDIGMPDKDGYALLRQVRAMDTEHGGLLPAIALTAYARESDRRQALEAGFQMHVSKPISPAILLAGVANLTGRTE